ncbi:HAD hydrolase-like protein [Pseudonocardia sp. DSM 110487]|uniref:HAD family hydrolase n=1 Tax=Pseudonocardia sp. DSM 110487 TaxID=2865833 RepID=UPI001C698387|nr:HAD family hydrolase [Pseudonocardia sp. DSM 110487]QYN32802.1 HAD hydrolase-like protein [Pseudonocardia sp. DSM 110487]
MTAIRWATFDCFGTLVDWRHGIANGIDLLFPGQGDELLEAYNGHEPAVQTEFPGLRYREVMAEALRRTARDARLDLRADDAHVLGDTIAYWPVFPEVAANLTRLREAGWRIALLTNCDQDIIGETQRRLGAPVDAVVTAEMVGSYKPNHNHFTRFAESFGATRDRWVHVAQSYFHDMEPAKALDVSRVWVNRNSDEHDPSIADAVLPDLDGLISTVESVHRKAQR